MLTYEFVFNCNKLVESNKHGATRLVSKVDGIPTVNQLRPITLLNQDYRLLSGILAKRLTSILGTICKSNQSCSVPGANICSSALNVISTIEGIARSNGFGALLSLDLFKAYDRVSLSFLKEVLLAMNIPQKFINFGFFYCIMMLTLLYS